MGDFIQDPSAQDGVVERMEPASAVPGIDWAGPTREEVAALRRHPRFGEAMTASMRVPLDLYHGNRILNLITNDRGRYILAIFALHLHYSRRPQDPGSGLTATRLQTMCAEQGVCSFGRAGALIRLLRWTGYLTDAPATQDRRVRLLMPTERMFEIHRERWRRQLHAVALVRPEAQEPLSSTIRPSIRPSRRGRSTNFSAVSASTATRRRSGRSPSAMPACSSCSASRWPGPRTTPRRLRARCRSRPPRWRNALTSRAAM